MSIKLRVTAFALFLTLFAMYAFQGFLTRIFYRKKYSTLPKIESPSESKPTRGVLLLANSVLAYSSPQKIRSFSESRDLTTVFLNSGTLDPDFLPAKYFLFQRLSEEL